MKFSQLLSLASLASGLAAAEGAWSFESGTVSVSSKSGDPVKESLSPGSALGQQLSLGPADSLKIVLTPLENGAPVRPHQAFLRLRDASTGLDESLTFQLNAAAKGKVTVTQKDLPFQLAGAREPLRAEIILASFGSTKPYRHHAFDLVMTQDPNATPQAAPSPPVRYSSRPEIHHVFRADPRSPPKIVSSAFALIVLAALPALVAAWLVCGANVGHLGKAMSSAPVAHGLFYGSILALEGLFFLYYTSWNLFQVLPAVGVVGAVAFVSGSRALSEVQQRRLAGLR